VRRARIPKTSNEVTETGGEGGIRTHGTVARTPVFKTGALNRSATSPDRTSLPEFGLMRNRRKFSSVATNPIVPAMRSKGSLGGRKMTSKIATLPLLLAAAMVVSSPASADWLNDDSQILSLVSDKRVYLSTPFGGEFPLLYRSSGRVSGDGSSFGLGKYMAPKETGKWWVSGGQLCQKFPTWYKGKTSCFKLRPTGDAKLRWRRDDGYSGRARIEG
jgi:hypothetical protein